MNTHLNLLKIGKTFSTLKRKQNYTHGTCIISKTEHLEREKKRDIETFVVIYRKILPAKYQAHYTSRVAELYERAQKMRVTICWRQKGSIE